MSRTLQSQASLCCGEKVMPMPTAVLVGALGPIGRGFQRLHKAGLARFAIANHENGELTVEIAVPVHFPDKIHGGCRSLAAYLGRRRPQPDLFAIYVCANVTFHWKLRNMLQAFALLGKLVMSYCSAYPSHQSSDRLKSFLSNRNIEAINLEIFLNL
jgi:hypothetical protein